MARTKASVGAKVSSGKSSKARCSVAPPPSTSSSSASGSGERSSRSQGGGGGNPLCPQPTPKWQRPITNFFIGKPSSAGTLNSDNEDDVSASTSKTKRHNIIESDEEEIATDDRPVNKELDDTIELEPLTGEQSHKIVEYYSKNGEGSDTEESKENLTQNGENHVQNGEKHAQNGELPSKVNKGKGKGKKTNKENVNNNSNSQEKRRSTKRDLDSSVDEESDTINKKAKV